MSLSTEVAAKAETEVHHHLQNKDPHVVILGGGFGGLYATRELVRQKVRITLIDRSNHHLFQPLLYQVATAALSPGDIAQPIRKIFRKNLNVQVLMAEALAVDPAQKIVRMSTGYIRYDYLIVATGATHAYFGHDEWKEVAHGLKSLEDAIEMRRMFLTAFEEAEAEPDEAMRKMLLTFVIVGAGPTGVELAGTMSEVARRTLAQEFRNIHPQNARILLLEGGPRVLPAFSPDLSESAHKQLLELGVEVRTNALVTNITRQAVFVGDERIETSRVFWAAGVSASPLGRTLGAPVDRAGRVKVQPDLSIEAHPEILVVGDLATLTDAKGKQVPGLAPAAIQMGRYAGKRVRAILEGKSSKPFAYFDKGSLATIGRAAAVGYSGPLKLHGLIAWLAWLFIHLFFLIGFRNRLFVILQWAWAYLSFSISARLITYYDVKKATTKAQRH